MNIDALVEALAKIIGERKNAIATARLVKGGENYGIDGTSESCDGSCER